MSNRTYDLQPADQSTTQWCFHILDKEEVESLAAAVAIGMRICLYGIPAEGKILLINYEDARMVVCDDIHHMLLIIEMELNEEENHEELFPADERRDLRGE